jgi:hypothetical protein
MNTARSVYLYTLQRCWVILHNYNNNATYPYFASSQIKLQKYAY